MGSSTPRVGVFHPGTQHSWQTALAFQEAGRLRWYATSVFYDAGRWPYRLEQCVPQPLSGVLHRNFTRRYHPELRVENIRQFGLWEWLESAAQRGHARRLATWANAVGNVRFCRSVIRLFEREPVDVLWGYNTSSLEVFRWAQPRGVRCILDQTIGHCIEMNAVMQAEQECDPEFFLQDYIPFSKADIARQNEELALADAVIVGSEFCAGTLVKNGCPVSKIHVVPYGYDENFFPKERPQRSLSKGRAVNFLFVGIIGPRKGIGHLLKAFAQIPSEKAGLTLVGSLDIPMATFRTYASRVNRILSLSRSEIVKHYENADCFIFPSLFEGGGIVLSEAIGAGLGIIQSSAATDVVQEGVNGLMLREVTGDRIKEAVLSVTDNHERLAAWQEASWHMRTEWTWRRYRERIVTGLWAR